MSAKDEMKSSMFRRWCCKEGKWIDDPSNSNPVDIKDVMVENCRLKEENARLKESLESAINMLNPDQYRIVKPTMMVGNNLESPFKD